VPADEPGTGHERVYGALLKLSRQEMDELRTAGVIQLGWRGDRIRPVAGQAND
jgi:hypothetical protein